MRIRTLVLAAALATLGTVPARAGERVDFFDNRGRRQGYAVIDREAGRIDYFDNRSRRTGWGRINREGGVENFDLRGRRRERGGIRPPGGVGEASPSR